MSVICQNVALLTTTTIRTILTVYVTTSLSQAVGRPTPLTSVVASASCTAYTAANTTTQRCMTSFATITVGNAAPPPTQVQVPVTITSQFYQTQFNTLMGTSCHTVPGPQVPSPPSQPPQDPTQPTPVQPTPTQPTPTQPTPTPTPTPRATPEPGITDTTYTTEYVTVTGSHPPNTSTTILTSNTPRPTTSSLSRNTVYTPLSAGDSVPAEISPSNSALALESSSKGLPVAAIAGGAAGAVVLVILLGLLAYLLIFKKSPKGYQRPVGDELNDQYHESTSTGQSGLYPQTQEQGAYHPYEDGSGYGTYGQQYQGTTGSQSLQYSDYAPPQGVSAQAQGFYTDAPDTQFWQQNMASGAVAALPPGAAAAVVVGHTSHLSTSSTGSARSQTSTAPLLNSGLHHQRPSQGPFLVPYRGYAEPGDG